MRLRVVRWPTGIVVDVRAFAPGAGGQLVATLRGTSIPIEQLPAFVDAVGRLRQAAAGARGAH